ncbi:hypothetical protein Droror1_Dr00016465 [Drosera rotundifolia]
MNYAAPVQAIMGMAGFNLDGFVSYPICWSLVRISKFGYTKTQAIKTQLNFQVGASSWSIYSRKLDTSI